MQIVQPKLFHLGQTRLVEKPSRHCDGARQQYLDAIGVPDWTTDAKSDAEKLIEVAGRGCYRSFQPGLNKNVSRIREGSMPYMLNVLESQHGSVIEHGYDTFVFYDVSRIFTHECVRHRIADYSQESMRFVRLDNLKAYYPRAFEAEMLGTLFDTIDWKGSPPVKDVWVANAADTLRDQFVEAFEEAEDRVKYLNNLLQLDQVKAFDAKKKITSAMRRMAPDGICTMILMTANHRMWRFVIEKRTHRSAEEEIRGPFGRAFETLLDTYPAMYQDAETEMVEDQLEVRFKNSKV